MRDAPGQLLLFDADAACCRCRRRLRVEASIQRGSGPVCVVKIEEERRGPVSEELTRRRQGAKDWEKVTMSESKEKDWNGRVVPEQESLDTKIVVWKITPHYEEGYDHALVRGYQDAMRYVSGVAEQLMEGIEEGDEATITITTRRMTLREYKELSR